MSKFISVGQLRQNPTQMLRDVRSGSTYTVTDRGEPIATIDGVQAGRWVPAQQIDTLLRELGENQAWAADIAEERAAIVLSDPWQVGK